MNDSSMAIVLDELYIIAASHAENRDIESQRPRAVSLRLH